MRPETVQLLKNLALGALLLVLVAGVLWGVWHVVRLEFVTIDQVVVSGGETINHEAIKEAVEVELEGEYWGFVPRRFSLTYPYADIVSVVTNVPRVKDPIVTRQQRVIRVQLAEFEPAGLWCTSNATTTPCVFIDEFGYGFAVAPMLDGGAYTRYIRVGSAATTSAVYADSTDFQHMRLLERLLAERGWPVERIELDQAQDAFVYLVGGGELKVTLRTSAEETVSNLEAVLTADEYSHFTPDTFTYIDLRFGNKVFVSEFGAPVEVDDVSATSTDSTAVTSPDPVTATSTAETGAV